MSGLRISLVNQNLLDVPCSLFFVKHIEGSMSAPEIALNTATGGRLQTAYEKHEKDDDFELSAKTPLPAIHVFNFHKEDLPFTYVSVDSYGRRILQVANNRGKARRKKLTVATAIHGPGAGLDTSEAMETLLAAFSSELPSLKNLGDSLEVILVEKNPNIFARLRERLKHLEEKGIIAFDGEAMVVRASESLKADTLRQSARRHLFVAMPFAKEFRNLYDFGIKGPVEQRHLKCERVDQDEFVGDIVERIKTRISTAELVVADITGSSANVFFEIGYAAGKNKPIVLLTQAQEPVPFDLHTQNHIRYDPHDIRELTRKLGETLDALLLDLAIPDGLEGHSMGTRNKGDR